MKRHLSLGQPNVKGTSCLDPDLDCPTVNMCERTWAGLLFNLLGVIGYCG